MSSLRLVIMLVLLSMGAALAPRQAAAQDAAVQPPTGVPGTTFAFFAFGFGRNADVVFWATAPDGSIVGDPNYRTTSNTEGRADWEWVAPPDAMPGIWTMVAQQAEFDEDEEAELVPDRFRKINFEIVPIEQIGDIPPGGSPDAPETQPRNVEPKVGTPGSLFTFFTTGFKPGERVSYWFNSPDGTLYPPEEREFVVLANDEGRADWEWVPPLDAATGIWQAVAFGQSSSTQRTIFFELVPLGQAIETPEAGPDRGAEPYVSSPDDTVAFFATGFARKERVSFWAHAPSGRLYKGNEVIANENGRADWFWRSPENAQRGVWRMIAFGQKSEVTREIQFEIR
jgi:hypothetical protein